MATDPLELVQESYAEPPTSLSGLLPYVDERVVGFRISLSPRARGDWHLSAVLYDWFTDEVLSNFDSAVDSIGVARDALDGWLGEHGEDRHQNDPKAPEITT